MDIDDDAHDLLQEVCIAFYNKIERIKPETAICYMYRMAHNAALNWKKQRNKTVLKSPAVFERIAAVDAKTDRYDIVNKAIASLPPNLALVIHMYYYDKLTYLEMSIQTGKSVKAIDSMLNRARIKLRKKIKMDEDGAFKLID